MATILITDDSAYMRAKIKAIVTRRGHVVVGEAENGNIAVEKCKELEPDFVTMDIIMNETGGLSALEDILNHSPNTVVIIISSMIDQKWFLEEAKVKGAKAFLNKTTGLQKINAVLDHLVGIPNVECLPQCDRPKKGGDYLTVTLESDTRLPKIFCQDAVKAIKTLREVIVSEDMKRFISTVHSMKSALENIGETTASELAQSLEQAARIGNREFISAYTENLEHTI